MSRKQWLLISTVLILAFHPAQADEPTGQKHLEYKSLTNPDAEPPGPKGNLDITSRRFGVLKDVDVKRQRVTLLLEGEAEATVWPVRADAEVRYAGWWGRLDQFAMGDRIWLWFETDTAKQPLAISFLCDELSEHDLYAPLKVKAVTGAPPTAIVVETVRNGKPVERSITLGTAELWRGGAKSPLNSLKDGEQVHVQTRGEEARLILDPAAFAARRSTQQAALRKRWTDQGLPGTLVFVHAERGEIELMLDHEAIRWGRSLQPGDKVSLQTDRAIPGAVRQVRPWHERTQVLLATDGSHRSLPAASERVSLRLVHPPQVADDDLFPTGLDRLRSKPDRIEWLASSIYCTCGMHDGCAGQPFTLAACDAVGKTPCGLAKRTRQEIAEFVEGDFTDRQIVKEFLDKRGPNLLRPHMSP
jgi:hypothetical protein